MGVKGKVAYLRQIQESNSPWTSCYSSTSVPRDKLDPSPSGVQPLCFCTASKGQVGSLRCGGRIHDWRQLSTLFSLKGFKIFGEIRGTSKYDPAGSCQWRDFLCISKIERICYLISYAGYSNCIYGFEVMITPGRPSLSFDKMVLTGPIAMIVWRPGSSSQQTGGEVQGMIETLAPVNLVHNAYASESLKSWGEEPKLSLVPLSQIKRATVKPPIYPRLLSDLRHAHKHTKKEKKKAY